MEKLWIINHINDININDLNEKSELFNKRRRLNKFLLKHVNLSFMRVCIFVFLF